MNIHYRGECMEFDGDFEEFIGEIVTSLKNEGRQGVTTLLSELDIVDCDDEDFTIESFSGNWVKCTANISKREFESIMRDLQKKHKFGFKVDKVDGFGVHFRIFVR